MAAPESPSFDHADSSRFASLLERFTRGWRDGAPVPIETLLPQVSADERPDAFLELLLLELTFRQSAGEKFLLADYQQRFPTYAAQVVEAFAPLSRSANRPPEDEGTDQTRVHTPGDSPEPDNQPGESLPNQIDGFEIRRVLGRGSFGTVYLAYDPKLQREVAIKVPRIAPEEESAEAWLKEARIVAQLEHPHIVPVLHVVLHLKSTREFPAYIVSKYIDGTDLATAMRTRRLDLSEAVRLVRDVADALNYAHSSPAGVIHRDIKPANLLLDRQGRVYVADFGLALREEDVKRAKQLLGTPAYMSPEQAAGEAHRVDGRSDVFSLGVVLYELLTGKRPFVGTDTAELLDEIQEAKPRPPRQRNPQIPPRLDEVCRKALARHANDRHTTAGDFRDELQDVLDRWLPGGRAALPSGPWPPAQAPGLVTPLTQLSPPTPGLATPHSATPGELTPRSGQTSASGSTATVKIVPKGLRAFDAGDAGFFLELLPGARDRDGLPESLRFWKRRIEPIEGERSFLVGLLCGPSGCGKSSLVKAGLLPRLSEEVLTVYLEATTDDTERRLLTQLHRHLPKLKQTDNLVDCLTAIRRGQAGLRERRLLVVIDQFEQWLHAHQGDEDVPLTRALRQCDGERLQCLLLVRDDYALSVYRFLKVLDIRLLQGENNAVVDRFDLDHARRVLTAFGRAFGKLPPEPTELSTAQQQFVDEAVGSLAEQHQVVPVRLALFAEMFKQRPWTPDALVQVGGAEGVGRVFLEETFRSDTAPPQYRLHAKGAQRVLTALLPEVGSDIKGHRRSRDELLSAAGYTQRPAEGAELLRILDGELRLISPVESAADEFDAPNDKGQSNPGAPSVRSTDYHLTHDYLVPSLRRWVEDILGSTPAGRAKLLLRERSRLWNDRPLNRNLPSVGEHLRIRRWVPVGERSDPERALLAQTARVHGRWGVFALAGMVLLAVGAGWLWQDRRQREAVAQVRVLQSAVASDWNRTFVTLRREGLVKLAERPLRDRLAEAEAAEDTLTAVKMRTGLLATQGDTTQAQPLGKSLLTLPAAEFGVVRELLAAASNPEVVAALWDQAADQPNRSAQQRFQALAGLAQLAPDDARWSDFGLFIARHLSSLPAAELVAWRPMLEPVRDALAPAVKDLVTQPSLDPIVRRSAAETLAEYGRDQGTLIAEALIQSEPPTFEVMFGVAVTNSDDAVRRFEQELEAPTPAEATEEALEKQNIQKSRAAAGLVRLGQEAKVWPLLVFDPQPDQPQTQDPSLRTEVLHALAEYRAPWEKVVARLAQGLRAAQQQPREACETSIQRALLVALGGYTGRMSEETRRTVREQLQLQTVFETDPDPGIHSACELLLRRWGEEAWLKSTHQKLKTQAQCPPVPQANEPRRWFVNEQCQTFVVFTPGVFTMGSPADERGRIEVNEPQHRRRIERSFAVATTEVTRAQYAVFAKAEGIQQEENPYSKTADDPQTGVNWYNAVRYCNWLSQAEGLQACYRISGKGDKPTVTMESEFMKRNGYRLPTEAEWEYAFRAGVGVAWGHGRAERRLGQYAWFLKTSEDHLWPVARLLPNEAGVFDMSGNALEWCQDGAFPYPRAAGEHATLLDDATTIVTNTTRVLRGSSFVSVSANVRAAFRNYDRPDVGNGGVGFRPSRTYP